MPPSLVHSPSPLVPNAAECRQAVTIGCFDGLHLGHKALLQRLRELACKQKLKTLVLTFDTYPAELFGHTGERLIERDLKLNTLRSLVDEVTELHFTHEMAALSSEQFIDRILQPLGTRLLLMGYDHSFGRPQGETDQDYKHLGAQRGIDVVRAEPLLSQGAPVSSTRIRNLLNTGRVSEIPPLLGTPYSLSGTVVRGRRIGRTIGFPTINVRPSDMRLKWPRNGAYAVHVAIDGNIYSGMANVGTRPTFGNSLETAIEVNLFDFDDTIYGEQVSIAFEHWLRPEEEFDSPKALAQQLVYDREQALDLLSGSPICEGSDV